MKYDIKGHYIRPLGSGFFPRHVLFMDTETGKTLCKDGEQHHRMKVGWTCLATFAKEAGIVKEEWRYWTDKEKMLFYIMGNADYSEDLWIVGNNIFFDLQVSGFFPYFAHKKWELDFIYENGLTYILVIKRGDATITIVSLTNYYMASVKELGRMIGKPKLEVNLNKINKDTLSIYCFRDVEICVDSFELWYSFIAKNDLGNFSLSRAGQSMKAFRHRFMHHKIYCHSDKMIRDMEGKASFGGRTEAFQLGKITGGPFVDLDINSMYPFIMQSKLLPVKAIDYYINISRTDCKEILVKYGGIVDATVNVDIPIFPIRIKNRVMFPVGTFRTTLCTESIKEAIKRGFIKRIHSMIVYEMDYIFKDFIDYFYSIRLKAKKEGNIPWDKICKLLMNSLYGKWGQYSPLEVSRSDCPKDNYSRFTIYDPITGKMDIVTEIFGTRIIEKGKKPSNQSVISIPAHVTDYGRIILWNIMEGIGREKIIYCDTDCVKIRKKHLPYVKYPISDSELGALKTESAYNNLVIRGLKDYQNDFVSKTKGIPRTAHTENKIDYSYDQFQRMKYHMKENISDYFVIRPVVKHMSGVYTKGKVNKDGSISPWTLPDQLKQIERLF